MRYLVPAAALAALFLVWRIFWPRDGESLVVYCAHDSIYAEKVLRDFEKRTGLRVATRFDTEATKSLGLVELLVREKDAPRCDVFWNNEMLGMIDLKKQGLLLPYKGSGFAEIPARFRDPDGAWTGFAARMRVFIFNTDRLSEDGIAPLLDGDLGRVAIAKPLYGTTLSHYSVLWQTQGAEAVKEWHQRCRTRHIVELNGNAAVKDAVAQGVCDLGFTDTDDFFAAKDAGKPVAFAPVRIGTGQTIVIPNTVAIIHGTKREAAAQRLVDFLISAETELALARSKSRQIPLGPVDEEKLPAEVRALSPWVEDGFDLSQLAPSRAACLTWLKAEYLR